MAANVDSSHCKITNKIFKSIQYINHWLMKIKLSQGDKVVRVNAWLWQTTLTKPLRQWQLDKTRYSRHVSCLDTDPVLTVTNDKEWENKHSLMDSLLRFGDRVRRGSHTGWRHSLLCLCVSRNGSRTTEINDLLVSPLNTSAQAFPPSQRSESGHQESWPRLLSSLICLSWHNEAVFR